MAKNLGPTGHYPLGGPYEPSDQGHMDVEFQVDRERRQAVLTFGTLLDWFILTPQNADALIHAVRREIAEVFGDVSYDRTKMQLHVQADTSRGVVEVRLPTISSRLKGDPEFWLALTARIEVARKQLA